MDDEGDFPAGAGKVGVKFEGVAAVEAFADEDGLVEGELLACDDGAFRGVVRRRRVGSGLVIFVLL